MVPRITGVIGVPTYSPRIRGDGPAARAALTEQELFSPYSRGWSRRGWFVAGIPLILPVFAGMVPRYSPVPVQPRYSPRIRGDGPLAYNAPAGAGGFSPYSRGWSPPDAQQLH